jgi:hypothetical protein
MTRAQHGSDGRFVANHELEPAPLVAPPKPHPHGKLRYLKQAYRDWIAAGGTPPIYGTFTVSGGIITSTGGQV